MKTLPGHATREETEELLATLEGFSLLEGDGLAAPVFIHLREVERDGRAARAFVFVRSRISYGPGGAVFTSGETLIRVVTARLRGAPRPPLTLVRRGLWSWLRTAFRPKVAIDAPAELGARYLLLAEDGEAALAALPMPLRERLAARPPDLDLELRGDRLVGWARGPLDEEGLDALAEETLDLLPLFDVPGYRA